MDVVMSLAMASSVSPSKLDKFYDHGLLKEHQTDTESHVNETKPASGDIVDLPHGLEGKEHQRSSVASLSESQRDYENARSVGGDVHPEPEKREKDNTEIEKSPSVHSGVSTSSYGFEKSPSTSSSYGNSEPSSASSFHEKSKSPSATSSYRNNYISPSSSSSHGNGKSSSDSSLGKYKDNSTEIVYNCTPDCSSSSDSMVTEHKKILEEYNDPDLDVVEATHRSQSSKSEIVVPATDERAASAISDVENKMMSRSSTRRSTSNQSVICTNSENARPQSKVSVNDECCEPMLDKSRSPKTKTISEVQAGKSSPVEMSKFTSLKCKDITHYTPDDEGRHSSSPLDGQVSDTCRPKQDEETRHTTQQHPQQRTINNNSSKLKSGKSVRTIGHSSELADGGSQSWKTWTELGSTSTGGTFTCSDSSTESIVAVQQIGINKKRFKYRKEYPRDTVVNMEKHEKEKRFCKKDPLKNKSTFSSNTSVYSAYSGHSCGNKLSLPTIDTSGPVQLTNSRKYAKSSSNSDAIEQWRYRDPLRNNIGNRIENQSRFKKQKNIKNNKPDILLIDPTHIRKYVYAVQDRPKVPVALKAEAMVRDGQLEVSVTDDRKGLPKSENVNVKITLVHKYVKGTKYGRNRGKRAKVKRDQFHDFDVDRDIVRHRAMRAPFNTYTDPEASKRHNKFYGLE